MAQEKKMAKQTKGDFFSTHITPYLLKDLQDPSDVGDYRCMWRRLEKIKGVQTLIKQGDTSSVVKIFATTICAGY